ncbi:MAG: hypothetical protein Q4F52_09165 [Bacteroidaceae bacterium]|nr:hypothetical protein [Bacteroidaceae bacterium]
MTKKITAAQMGVIAAANKGDYAQLSKADLAEVTRFCPETMCAILGGISNREMRRHVALIMSKAWAKWFRNLCRTTDVGYGYGYDNFIAGMAYLGMSYITQWQPVGPNCMEAYLYEVCNQMDMEETPWQ